MPGLKDRLVALGLPAGAAKIAVNARPPGIDGT